MGHQYKAIQWNGNKLVYDLFVGVFIIVFLGVFIALGLKPHASGNTADPVVLAIRGLGVTAFTLLTIILMIGPLARLSPRFLPILYNRRHLGVITFFVAAAHFGLALLWYHGGGPINPLVSLFVSNPLYDRIPGFPFEVLGLAAFVILLLMAATSHDFWLNNLSAPVWKALHMLVYPAYFLLVFHIILGALYTEKSLVYPVLTFSTLLVVGGLHLVAGWQAWTGDRGLRLRDRADWALVGDPMSIADGRAVIVPLPGDERVAIFREGRALSAVTNVCRHQNGPLGEGRIVDGCITCPWHGWQYRKEDGVSPPPFTEKIATYNLRLEDGQLFVHHKPNPPGTLVTPLEITHGTT